MIIGIYPYNKKYTELDSSVLDPHAIPNKYLIQVLQGLYQRNIVSLGEISSVSISPKDSLGSVHPLTLIENVEKIIIHTGTSILRGSPGGKSFSSGSIVLIKDNNFYSIRTNKYIPSFIPAECIPSNWCESSTIIDECIKNGGYISWVHWNINVSCLPI